MDVSDILKQQQTWLDKIHEAAAKKIDPKEALQLPLDAKKQKVSELQAQVQQLAARKDELVKNYDRAINEAQKQIDTLKRELEQDESNRKAPTPAPPTNPQKPTPPRNKRPS
jgi:predicted RNase H-like nuclease (RuvC/YqgF family)